MNNLLVALAVFVITVVGAMFAVPYFVDWNTYRSNFEEEASRVIGREVQVDGDVTLHLLPTPYFRLEKVRIADASADLTFFKADSLSIKLSVPPMFRGIIEANEIEFQRPVVRLVTDAKDEWNWQRFAKQLGNTSYMPARVTLTSVKIVDGVLAMHGADGIERTRLQGVNGELSAPSLEGPYRFRGSYVAGRAEREVRFATSAPDADGGVRMRASLRFLDTGGTYVFDGRATDMMSKPHLEGELTARLPIAGLWQTPAQTAPPPRRAGASDEEHKLESGDASFELKSAVKADAAGAQLSDLTLSFEQGGRPQIVTGSVRVNWRNDLALDMSLAARWLDLDRITGSDEHSGPVEGIAKFAARLRDFAPGRKAQVTLALEQASLGSEAIGPLQIVLKRTDDKLDIQELHVALPGGTRAELQGSIFDAAQSVVFNGRLALRGTSVARFLTWATGRAVPIEARADGAFGLRAQVAADEAHVAARDIVGNLSGTTLSGTAQYRWQGTPELAVALEGPQIDARSFMPAGASLSDMYDFLLRSSDTKQVATQPQTTPQAGWRGVPADLSLRINAGQLATAGRVYRDVSAVMELKSGNIRQLQLRLAGDEGYKLEIDGAVDGARTRPKGSVRGATTVSAPSGVAPVMDLLGVPQAFRPAEGRAKAMVPLRLAGTMVFGARTATSSDLVLDGSAAGAPMRISARFDGAPGGWRTGAADVIATADSPDGLKVVNLLMPWHTSTGPGPGRLLIKATGVPEQGMSTIATLAIGEAGLNFRGQVTAADAGLKSTGEMDVRVPDGGPLAVLAGLSPPIALDGVPVTGRLMLVAEDGKIAFEKLATTIGKSRVGGFIRLSDAGERRHIDAHLDVDELRISQLLAPLLDHRLAIASEAEAAVAGRENVWPDAPFGVDAFDAFEGKIQITSKRLGLDDQLTLDRAKVTIALSPGKIDVSEISGTGLGGLVNGSVEISKAPAGADIRGKLDVAGVLEAFSKGASPRASGPIKAALEFSGRGLSPRSLISAAQGRGTLEFGDAKLDALWPGAIILAADAGLQAEPDKLAATVQRVLSAGLSSGSIPLGQKPVGLEIADGVLRTNPITFEAKEGRTTGAAILDLRALTFESHWRLEATGSMVETTSKQLPTIGVAYSGPLAALGNVEPRIDAARLEQELSARKIERDVEELERLRRLDEQRRLMEAERLRKQFDQLPPPVHRQQLPTAVPVTPSSRDMRPVAPPG